MRCTFSLKHYREILEHAINQGYSFLTLKEYFQQSEIPEKAIVLRHDIDWSIEKAFIIAELENSLGINSTCFVRVHSKNYDPFAPENARKLGRMKDMGFELGLHFEPIFTDIAGEDASELLEKDKRILEGLIGKICGVAEHLPKRSSPNQRLWKDELYRFNLDYEAYSPRILSRMKYISDSNGQWREKCLCHAITQEPHIYTLIHPIWWFPGYQTNRKDIINKLLEGW